MLKKKTTSQPQLFGPIFSVLFVAGSFFATQIWAIIFISPLLQIVSGDISSAESLLRSNAWLNLVYILLFEGILILTLNTLLKTEFGSNLKVLGLNKLRLKYTGYALAGFAAYMVLYILGVTLAKEIIPSLDLEQKQEIGFQTTTRGLALLPAFISLVIVAPIAEEIVVRGFLFGGLRTKLPFIMSATITSGLFAAAHLAASKEGPLWVAGIDTFILSLVLCYLREKTDSLWPSIVVHMLKNGLAFIVLFNILSYFR